MNIFVNVAKAIIAAQELIIGPVAWKEAAKVTGIHIDIENKIISIQGEKTKAIDDLVQQYERLFGRAAVEVCREAAREFLISIPESEIPPSLR